MIEFVKTYGVGMAGTIASLVYLYYSIKERIWLWPWGIIASLLSIAVFYSSRLYADMGLQVYYLVISAYGWWYWGAGKQSASDDVPIVHLKLKQGIGLLLIGMACYVVLLLVLLNVPQWLSIPASEMPYLDALTTAASFVATWMLARKIIEHWLVWIVVDLISMVMYIYKALIYNGSGDLYFYSFLFLVYTIGAYWGYRQWQKLMTHEAA